MKNQVRMTAEQAAAAILSTGDPRSAEYRAGLENRLDWHFRGKPKGAGLCNCPHPPGTAQADAWFAGQERGDFEMAAQLLNMISEGEPCESQ